MKTCAEWWNESVQCVRHRQETQTGCLMIAPAPIDGVKLSPVPAGSVIRYAGVQVPGLSATK